MFGKTLRAKADSAKVAISVAVWVEKFGAHFLFAIIAISVGINVNVAVSVRKSAGIFFTFIAFSVTVFIDFYRNVIKDYSAIFASAVFFRTD